MAKMRPPYTPEFRRQLVELVRAGRSPDEVGPGVRADRAVDPELGRAGGARRGQRRRRIDDSGARGAFQPAHRRLVDGHVAGDTAGATP
jgi:hypothetical protein